VVGLEALVRWDHPERGILHPDQFISVAEQTGLIVPLGEWILSQVCQDQLRLRDIKPDLGRIMVNLSARQFQDPKLLQILPRLFTETGCAAGWLGLEITEHLLMTETKNAIKVLARLRDLGISISIDDFGKGLASLNCLKRLPIDSIKIDHSLVRDMAVNTNSQAISATLIHLGHQLGLQVAAEGIETTDQLAFLQENQCHYGQGHLFGHPVLLSDILDLLRDGLTLPSKQSEYACR
jgi:EAL domain-containing protein (putative c-di-GMP-specific phosphodiesterase class I)